MTNYKQLLEAKYNYEAHLYDINVKLQRMQQEGKPISKQQKYLEHKAELEAALQRILKQLEPYQQIQEKIGSPPSPPQQPTMPADWNPRTGKTEAAGEGKRNAGKALIVFGIFITIISFGAGSWQGGVLGFIINIIGIALYAAGNREQGRSTSYFGGGFVSTGD
jgi:hypothetical protein